jgi:IS1 family transposase
MGSFLLPRGGTMVQLEITPDEREILLELLQSCLSDLHSEIAHTDNYDYREMLKNRKHVLQKLAAALESSKEKPLAV